MTLHHALIPLLPLLAALIVGLVGNRLPRSLQHGLPILGVATSLVLSAITFGETLHSPPLHETLYTWFANDTLHISIGFLLDRLTSMMLLVVTFVSLMVHIYTIGYMHDDTGYARFFSYISLFTFAMLMLVMSDNLIQLFFAWEGVGLVSYLLIGFWFTRPTAIYANLKAFLVNRVGDFGFLLGIALLFAYTQHMDYASLFAQAETLTQTTLHIMGIEVSVLTLICLLLFVGAMGKSAQIPLHVWLPDSMEGPTPISALIHAATMVTAGIFMVARLSPLFEHSDVALSVMMVIGSLTAVLMGILGVVQNDIKRIIAYSTLSQLGYMTVALGASAYPLAMFHLMTHACFKALLFLSAGSVIMAMHHEQNILHMGGLRKYLPITWICTLIGTLALVGTPFFAGFYSKDSIIEAVKLSTLPVSSLAYAALLGGVFITALYSFRLYFVVFHGDEHWHTSHQHNHPISTPHEPTMVVTFPLILLAIPSLILGGLAISPLLHGNFFADAITVNATAHPAMAQLSHHAASAWLLAWHGLWSLPMLLIVLGAGIAWLTTQKLQGYTLPIILRPYKNGLMRVLKSAYGFDAFYAWFFARGSCYLGEKLWQWGDKTAIDAGMVHGTVGLVKKLAQRLRTLQSGRLYHYATVMMLGIFLAMTALIGISPL